VVTVRGRLTLTTQALRRPPACCTSLKVRHNWSNALRAMGHLLRTIEADGRAVAGQLLAFSTTIAGCWMFHFQHITQLGVVVAADCGSLLMQSSKATRTGQAA